MSPEQKALNLLIVGLAEENIRLAEAQSALARMVLAQRRLIDATEQVCVAYADVPRWRRGIRSRMRRELQQLRDELKPEADRAQIDALLARAETQREHREAQLSTLRDLLKRME